MPQLGFCTEGIGKPLKDFLQGSGMNEQPAVLKDHCVQWLDVRREKGGSRKNQNKN